MTLFFIIIVTRTHIGVCVGMHMNMHVYNLLSPFSAAEVASPMLYMFLEIPIPIFIVATPVLGH